MVARLPEERVVGAGHALYVVHVAGCLAAAVGAAVGAALAKRMLGQEEPPLFPPPMRVAAGVGVAAMLRRPAALRQWLVLSWSPGHASIVPSEAASGQSRRIARSRKHASALLEQTLNPAHPPRSSPPMPEKREPQVTLVFSTARESRPADRPSSGEGPTHVRGSPARRRTRAACRFVRRER